MADASAPPPRPRPHKRRKPPHPHSTKLTTSTTHTTSTSTLRKKIRDLSRFLAKKTTLPANVRLDSERALDAFRHELSAAQGSARDAKMAKKYHMVRFFERKKASRKLAQLVRRRRQGEAAAEEADDALEGLIHDAEVEVNYTVYYPRGEKYISLFRDPRGDPKVVAKRDTIKRGIEKQMEAGTLGSGHEGDDMDMGDAEVKREKGEKKRKREAEPEVEEEQDDFFEFS